jgi:hypothetical protein
LNRSSDIANDVANDVLREREKERTKLHGIEKKMHIMS